MKHVVLLIITIFSIHLSASAQNKPNQESLLWRISGKGMAKPSFLFGTIHLICPADYIWTEKMRQSLDASAKVCFEMDLDDNEVMMSAGAGFMDNSGKKLQDYFTPAQYKQLKQFVKDSIGMDISMFQQMKPIAIESIISMKTTKCADPVSYEEKIMTKAKALNKEILGLEVPSEQIEALNSTTPADSVAQEVMDEMTEFTKNKKEYNDMVTAYKNQQLTKLYETITSGKGLGEGMSVLLDDRNKKWISRMSDKMSRSSVFFAVGAGHLLGDNGVINLLRKAGYTLEPVL